MRPEPDVDAAGVERVVAPREQTQEVPLLEGGEADGAVGPVGHGHPRAGAVLAGGELGYEGVVEAAAAAPGGRGGGGGGSGGGGRRVEVASELGEEEVVGGEEEGGGDDGDDGDEERGEGVGGWGRGRRGWEEEVAPLGAVVAAVPLGAVL